MALVQRRGQVASGSVEPTDPGSPAPATQIDDSARSLVRGNTFVQAARDSGYLSTALALAELVDNSIQAGAARIDIMVDSVPGAALVEYRICIVDDGAGMNHTSLAEALRFGGSTRFGDRVGQGRFGMGLPNASVSQARRIEVISWQGGADPLATFLDVDEFARNPNARIPIPCASDSVEWLPQCRQYPSGTAVIWTKCDRIKYKRTGALLQHLHVTLGRVFRRFLARGLALKVNGDQVLPQDPSRIFPAPPGSGSVAALPPLAFCFRVPSSGETTSVVDVRFFELPVEQWSELPASAKRSYGIANGAGVSVLRADREVAMGWLFVGTKRRENYDDWWRCEVSFQPDLDELFGVTHNKQGIRPTKALLDSLVPTLEAQARRLNRVVRQKFESLRLARDPAVERAEEMHHRLLPIPILPSGGRKPSAATVGPMRYQLRCEPSERSEFVELTEGRGRTAVIINTNHPFYRHLYHPLHSLPRPESGRSLDLLLLALARAMIACRTEPGRESLDSLIAVWSDATAALLEER